MNHDEVSSFRPRADRCGYCRRSDGLSAQHLRCQTTGVLADLHGPRSLVRDGIVPEVIPRNTEGPQMIYRDAGN